jgi:hypothetical protein
VWCSADEKNGDEPGRVRRKEVLVPVGKGIVASDPTGSSQGRFARTATILGV